MVVKGAGQLHIHLRNEEGVLDFFSCVSLLNQRNDRESLSNLKNNRVRSSSSSSSFVSFFFVLLASFFLHFVSLSFSSNSSGLFSAVRRLFVCLFICLFFYLSIERVTRKIPT